MIDTLFRLDGSEYTNNNVTYATSSAMIDLLIKDSGHHIGVM